MSNFQSVLSSYINSADVMRVKRESKISKKSIKTQIERSHPLTSTEQSSAGGGRVKNKYCTCAERNIVSQAAAGEQYKMICSA